MRELESFEVNAVAAGSGQAIGANLVEQGAYAAISGGCLGAAVGFTIGGPPGAAVLGLAGAGIGFISGMVGYALAQYQ